MKKWEYRLDRDFSKSNVCCSVLKLLRFVVYGEEKFALIVVLAPSLTAGSVPDGRPTYVQTGG